MDGQSTPISRHPAAILSVYRHKVLQTLSGSRCFCPFKVLYRRGTNKAVSGTF